MSLVWVSIGEVLALRDQASKGKSGRDIPLHPALQAALHALKAQRGEKARPDWPVIYSERGCGMSANTVVHWFLRHFRDLGFDGCSSHSGRRTFTDKGRAENYRGRGVATEYLAIGGACVAADHPALCGGG